ncbi:PLD nuclease N-terminal domain-containing protein [Winogradskyella tangerina]|uniref:PLD nuclease N-terminal domain-containing protein n=1 Tax=Winogradskyella tangerina TaxID=2023240 RepID=UPI000DBE165A|nr:PLD nuclease N-terminal domain-containing protein [Winogradskyella tangerina]
MTTILSIGPWQIILLLVFVFIGLLPTIIALIDIVRNEFTGNNKIVWLLVVLFGNFIGAVLYFLIGRQQKLPRTDQTNLT